MEKRGKGGKRWREKELISKRLFCPFYAANARQHFGGRGQVLLVAFTQPIYTFDELLLLLLILQQLLEY